VGWETGASGFKGPWTAQPQNKRGHVEDETFFLSRAEISARWAGEDGREDVDVQEREGTGNVADVDMVREIGAVRFFLLFVSETALDREWVRFKVLNAVVTEKPFLFDARSFQIQVRFRHGGKRQGFHRGGRESRSRSRRTRRCFKRSCCTCCFKRKVGSIAFQRGAKYERDAPLKMLAELDEKQFEKRKKYTKKAKAFMTSPRPADFISPAPPPPKKECTVYVPATIKPFD
jgi:hypothetical protein